MCCDTVNEKPETRETPGKDRSAEAGPAWPCHRWMKRLMASGMPKQTPCCGEPEEAKLSTPRQEHADGS